MYFIYVHVKMWHDNSLSNISFDILFGIMPGLKVCYSAGVTICLLLKSILYVLMRKGRWLDGLNG